MRKEDMRSSERNETLLQGQIVHSNGYSRTLCVIVDISDGGARIEIPTMVPIPEAFELLVPLRGAKYPAHIVWRHAREIGVSFSNGAAVPKPSMSDSSKEILNRMLELESENSELKDHIRTMQLEMDKLRRRVEASQVGYSKTF
ncbi:MAG: hypothetical protein CFE31_02300 [Rhizobiales bacterium PAR1]|nr:MAG: hypothetical protein CFE31_02300 [Rhizobiales bacterium PAR1]